MADNTPVPRATGDTLKIASDEITYGGEPAQVQVVKMVTGGPGEGNEVGPDSPLHTTVVDGQFGYASGTIAGTVQVPAGARLRRVALLASSDGAATVGIGEGNAITIPAGASWDENITGDLIAPAVLFAGAVATYYVAWAV